MKSQESPVVNAWFVRALPLFPILVALGLVCYTTVARGRVEKVETQANALRSLYTSLGLPATATNEQLAARLTAIDRDQEEARQSRIARTVGLGTDWTKIVQRLERLAPKEQAAALKTITSEYHLPANLPLKKIENIVLMRQITVVLGPLPAATMQQSIQ